MNVVVSSDAREQFVVDDGQSVGGASLRIGGAVGQDLIANQALARRPSCCVSRLPKFRISARIWKAWRRPLMFVNRSCVTLRSAALDERQEDRTALRVFAAVLAQVRVLRDVRLQRLRLLGGGERAALRRVNGAKFISD